jgi:nitroreductase
MKFADLALARRSVRAFTPVPIPRDQVAQLLTTARTAPSGANLQPGRFVVLTGAALADLVSALEEARYAGRPEVSEYDWFPDPMPDDLKAQQRATGFGLYAALGIERRDLAGRSEQFAQNYRFFGAPVGIVVTIDRRFGSGGFLDLGMALQTLLLAAAGEGLGACGIGALANHADVVAEHLDLPAHEMVVCGVALGHVAASAVNDYRTTRLDLSDFAVFSGFDAD